MILHCTYQAGVDWKIMNKQTEVDTDKILQTSKHCYTVNGKTMCNKTLALGLCNTFKLETTFYYIILLALCTLGLRNLHDQIFKHYI